MLVKRGLYRANIRSRTFTLRVIPGLFLFLWPLLSFPQTNTIIYDGITGIHDVAFQNDTAIISGLIPDSPADRAGMTPGDQILTINDSEVSGKGMDTRAIKQLLLDRSGSPIELKIKREVKENPLHFAFQRDPYLYQIDSYDYLYLLDSLKQWDIYDIMSLALDTLFKDPLMAEIKVDSVKEVSPAIKNRIWPGDQSISLADEVDKDFSSHCVWLKFTTENRLTESRIYVFNVPEIRGKDSLTVFYTLPTGELVEKKSGILIPVEDRDFVYKNWHAFKVRLNRGEKQTFYLRWKAEDSVGLPHLQIYAHNTIVTYDRFERMLLFGFLVTMLIISAFFLLLSVVMQSRHYLYFSLYIGSLVVFLFITEGYLNEYAWGEDNFFLKFLDKFQPYIMSWISIFFLLFGIAYLELRKTLKNWYRGVIIILSLTGIRIVLVAIEVAFNLDYPALLENIFTVVWVLTVGIIPLFILIPPAIIRIKNGFRPAWYFLAANLVLIPLIYVTLYSSTYSTSVIGAYESIFSRLFISSGMYIAAILQIVIFSFGIARKMRLDEIEKKRIQQQIIDQLKVNEKLKDKVNLELEQKVIERTREISEKSKQITDSIDYARYIQHAVFPREEYLDQIMHEYFVLFKPKDIVSGDFYWIKEVHGSIIVVAADCTGHGVPGAFMSMLGITLLNEQLANSSFDDPGEILDNLRDKVKEMLDQKGRLEEQKDGIEMSLAIIHPEKKELRFAGANNPLFLIRGNSRITVGKEPDTVHSLEGNDVQLHEFKGDKQPIGFHWEEKKFTSHRIPLIQKDVLYLFTDGFIDQFGSEHRKKFKTHRFKKLLLSIHKEPMEIQKKLLDEAFESWRNGIEQIDDVCVIGIRI